MLRVRELQDYAKNDFELRQFVINGEIAHKIYSNFEWTDADGYLRDFVMKDREEAVRDWMQARAGGRGGRQTAGGVCESACRCGAPHSHQSHTVERVVAVHSGVASWSPTSLCSDRRAMTRR